MKKSNIIIIVVIVAIIAIAALVLTSGGSASTINVVGSTSVQPVAEKLAEDYQNAHGNVKINVQGGGSSVGIKSAQDGTADIGTSSKDLKADEKQGLTEYVLGQDGIVIAVNTKNTVSDLSTEQLKDIYSGKITNWKDVGGPDEEIHLVTREEGSGTLDAFQTMIMGKDTKIKSDAIVQSSTEAVKQSVKQDPAAIGFVSYASMSNDVKAVTVGGVAPSDATIADGSYELQRPFIFLVKGTPTGDVKEFIDWVMSAEGTKVLNEEKIVKSTNNSTNSSK
ncbi:phosphate ABC transporter substrate-binding protein [Methanobrevibacter sp. TMH8]|uniref:phosphate ABC transporter substrate-binding protein n=1 Tax=Methanobrevibacter sp. TMH8 TaxID=2848611 RepID=UPI001CCC398D|nr:phosphate ABC transporter substrate-binding protein [Methanobrevibacter sp. TMH8]MBZ9570816.1 phosphate ABC transporter substrate-binding protein [Methanobrevibacter sp. TMH8]